MLLFVIVVGVVGEVVCLQEEDGMRVDNVFFVLGEVWKRHVYYEVVLDFKKRGIFFGIALGGGSQPQFELELHSVQGVTLIHISLCRRSPPCLF